MSAYLDPVEEGRRIVLDKAVIFIGRAAECDVVLTRSRRVSRKHCCIAQVDDKYVVRDLASMNGVRINGKRVRKQAAVTLGDEVSIGDVRYVLRSAVEAAAPQANGSHGAQKAPAPAPPSPPKQPAPLQPVPSEDFPVPIDEADDASHEAQTPPSGPFAQADQAGDRPAADDLDDWEILDEIDDEEGDHWQLEQ